MASPRKTSTMAPITSWSRALWLPVMVTLLQLLQEANTEDTFLGPNGNGEMELTTHVAVLSEPLGGALDDTSPGEDMKEILPVSRGPQNDTQRQRLPDDSFVNDSIKRLGIMKPNVKVANTTATAEQQKAQTPETDYVTSGTEVPPAPSPSVRRIYHKGHLVSSNVRKDKDASAGRRPQPSGGAHRTNVQDFRIQPDRSNGSASAAASRQKRKHSDATASKFYNYKLLYDDKKTGELQRKATEFYAWIFGAAMLTLGSLTTMTSCFVFCFCSDKFKKRRDSRRNLGDKAGEYQRVESVSSIVEQSGLYDADQSGLYDDDEEPIDNVTII